MRTVCLALASAAVALAAAKTDNSKITFHKDVLPVLQKNCQGCHRPGEAAPMSFMSYKETRPWAKAIREVVISKRMPPWFADAHIGKFANDRSLSQGEIETFVRWADTGAAEGSPKEAPPAKEFVTGWNVGKPDYIVEMPTDFGVPATGTIEYTYFVIPTGFTEDKWVRLAEARPGNRKVVHHIIAFVREPGSKWMRDAKPGVPFVPQKKKGNSGGEGGGMGGEFLVGYAPGTVPETLEPGQAKLIKAGSDIVLQMHYTANGKSETDRSRVGFVFAKELPTERVLTIAAANQGFVIPPGADNHEVKADLTLHADSKLLMMLPHMHLRGKSFSYRVVYPDGKAEDLLNVSKYDFNWQLSYVPDKPVVLPKGSRIECIAHFDNSANNKDNPDPKAEVRYGDQSWEEMMFGFFNVAIDAKVNPRELMQQKKKAATQTGGE